MTDRSLSRISSVALEGGGVHGLAYLPAITRLLRLRAPIRTVAGTSAGAITAFLVALGYSPDALKRLMVETPWRKFGRAYKPGAILRLPWRRGLNSTDYARAWLSDLVTAMPPHWLTFSALEKRNGIRLLVGATEYRRVSGQLIAAPFVFGPEETPEVPVVDAVLASMAVPVFFDPVEIGGRWYCDGGVTMNHPIHLLDEEPLETVLGLRVDTSAEVAADDPMAWHSSGRPGVLELIGANVELARSVANRSYVSDDLWERTIRIEVPPEAGSALDFRMTQRRADALIAAGSSAMVKWLAGG